MRPRTVIFEIASLLTAIRNCEQNHNDTWASRHEQRLDALCRDHLPSGSGWDIGTTLALSACNAGRIVFTGAWHHMDQYGGYAGWSYHRVTVTPVFDGIAVKVSGRDRNAIKDYLAEMFHAALTALIVPVRIGGDWELHYAAADAAGAFIASGDATVPPDTETAPAITAGG